jgi:ribosomal protein L17
MEFLLANGANALIQDDQDKTALDRARTKRAQIEQLKGMGPKKKQKLANYNAIINL